VFRLLPRRVRCAGMLLIGVLSLTGCATNSAAVVDTQVVTETSSPTAIALGNPIGSDGGQKFPNVLSAVVTKSTDDTYVVEATLSSPYDTPQRYADAWRVVDRDGNVLGVRELSHDHQTEQPFTRTLDGVSIPPNVDVVIIEGRDQVNGWGGRRVEVPVSR
jgi:hypothetical protein